jgi:putative OPT family oligopeptide transporter
MLVGASYTLFRMRKQLGVGMARAVSDLKKSAAAHEVSDRTERDLSSKIVFAGVGVVLLAMFALYYFFISGAGNLTSGQVIAGAAVAALVMVVLGFFFAAVSGNLVGMIGSSNNPVSGLTLCTLVVAALLLVLLGVTGVGGVAAVLGVAAVVCVSSAVAGELLQDFKVGYILGGTPRTIQIVELVAVTVASLIMYFPLLVLHQGNINEGGIGFGDPRLSAPQAGLMASLAQGIVGGDMAWPLVTVGMLMGVVMIMVQVRSPMLVAVGMYLPFATTSAIFVGGVLRWVADALSEKKGHNAAQKSRVESIGVLTASGLIAGEALVGLVIATFAYFEKPIPAILESPSYLVGLLVLAVIAYTLIGIPLDKAGSPDEPAMPQAIM